MANGHGGSRNNSGRKKKQVAPEYQGPDIKDLKGLTPFDLWIAILRDSKSPLPYKLMVCDKLAPFMHARIAPKQQEAGQGELALTVDESGEPVPQSSSPFGGLPPGALPPRSRIN